MTTTIAPLFYLSVYDSASRAYVPVGSGLPRAEAVASAFRRFRADGRDWQVADDRREVVYALPRDIYADETAPLRAAEESAAQAAFDAKRA